MANITLDSQIFIANPMAADRDSTSPNLWARDRDPSVASSRGPKTPQHATHGPQRGAGGASQDDAVLISSDDESDYGDLDDGISDISFPPIKELLSGRKDVEPGTVAGIGMYLILYPWGVVTLTRLGRRKSQRYTRRPLPPLCCRAVRDRGGRPRR
jgi:hypothetical protein